MSTEEVYDVIIIGGGPAGLSAAQYTSRAKLKTVVLDKSPSAGALSMSSRIENYPGLTNPLPGKELLDIFRDQAVNFGAEYVETKVIGVKLDGEVKEVNSLDKTYKGKTIIIATGSMGRTATIKGEKEFVGKGVCYCAICDAAIFFEQTVCVLGDTEEALNEALVITRFASTAYLISPSKTLKAPDDHPALSAANLTVMKGYKTMEIVGNNVVEKLIVRNSDTDEEKEIPANGVFIYLHGSKPVVDFLGSSVEFGEGLCVAANKMMETSIPGIFAAGDVTCTEIRQVVTAASNGCVAALSAEKYIHHRKRTKLDWKH